jgi:S1-C subfamily serine protease
MGDLKVGDEIKLFGLRDQRQYNQYGRVISSSRNALTNHPETRELVSTTYDTFLTDAYGTPGFSGGVFTNLRGEFAGLALYIQRNENEQIGHAGGAKARNIANFIKESAYELNRLSK